MVTRKSRATRKPTLSKRGIGDPLDYFPYEVWVKCISFAVFNEPCGPLPLLLVSPRWERVLIETPEAWTNIIIDGGEDLLARITTFLCLSQNHLVNIRFIFPAEAWLRTISILLDYSYKIRTMTLSTKDRPFSHNIAPLFQCLDPTDKYSYSGLQELTCEFVPSNLQIQDNFVSACPSLNSITGLHTNFKYHACPIKKYYLTLGGDTDESEVAKWIRTASSLWILERQGIQDDTGSTIFKECAPNLEELRIEAYYYGFGGTFLHSFYPSIRKLILSIPTNASTQLATSLYLFPNLKHLELLVTYTQFNPINTQLPSTEMPRLHTFILKEHGYSGSCILGNILQALAENQALEQINSVAIYFVDGHSVTTATLTSLFQAVKAVVSLKLDTSYQVEADCKELPCEFPNLEALYIRTPDPLRFIGAPNLQTLEFTYSGCCYSSPDLEWFGDKVSKLAVDSDTFSSMVTRLQTLQADKPPFAAVERISWPNTGYGPAQQTTILQNLTTVEFLKQVQYTNTELCTLDYFCMHLLRNTKACPQLQWIRSADFPCWDLLFSTLYQRSSDMMMASVRVLGFPSMPVNSLVKLIVALLGDQHPKPYGDAIETAIQKRFLQIHASTCLMCVAAGYTQCVKTTTPDNESEHSDLEEEEDNRLGRDKGKGREMADLDPTDCLDFLILPQVQLQGPDDQREYNWEWWEKRLEKRFEAGSREVRRTCSRHRDDSGPVNITRYTLS